MNYEFKVVEEKLKNEFEWLKEEYSISSFSLHPLKIVNYQNYNKNYKNNHDDDCQKKEIDVFFLGSEEGKGPIEYCIFMTFSVPFAPRYLEELLIKRGVKEEHLLYFILYHEYGHILQKQRTYQQQGRNGLIKEREEQEKLLWELNEKQITQEEYTLAYRELWFEKEADDFAFHVYQKRKQTL